MTLLDTERTASADGGGSWARWWRDHEGVAFGVACILAVLPTLVWGVVGAGYLTDDFWMALWLDEFSVWEGMKRIAFDRPGRPLAAVYYAFSYQVLGESIVSHVVLLVGVNLAMVDGLRRLGRFFLPPHHLLPALLLFATFANHSTTRLWFVVGTYPLAVAMVAYAGVLMIRRNIVAPALLLAGAILLYEGVAGFCGIVLGAVLWRHRDRVRTLLVPAVATAVAAAFMYLNSPKARAQQSGTYPEPFEFSGTLLPAQFGEGLVGSAALGRFMLVTVGFLVLVAIVLRWFPSFQRPSAFHALVLAGVVVCVAGAGPMLVGGSVFAVSGVNDRNNLMPSIGAALVLAGPIVTIGRRRPRLALSLVVAAAIGSTALSVRDVGVYQQAVVDGHAVEDAVAATIPDPDRYAGTSVVFVRSLPSDEGVAAFIESYDIQGAMRLLRGGDWSFLRVHAAEACRASLPIYELDWRARSVEPVAPTSLCET